MNLVDVVSMASSVILALSVVVGGAIGLRRYRRSLDISAAELLMDMEVEFRQVQPTLLRLEMLRTYRSTYAKALARTLTMGPLADSEVDRIQEIDRALRFLFLCTVLHSELRVEQAVLARSYYWHARMLRDREKRPELWRYVATNYQRLSTWLEDHEECFRHYRRSGQWKPRLARGKSSVAVRKSNLANRLGLIARRGKFSNLDLQVLQDYPTHRELVGQLEPVLGGQFRASMEDWFGNRTRLDYLRDWCVFAAFDPSMNQHVGICGFYTQGTDNPDRYWLGWLAVLPQCRRRGIGSAMIAEVASQVESRGGKELWVYTSPENASALQFYAANQFARRGMFGELGLTQDAAQDDSITLSLVLQHQA